jgi:urease subunit alpha
LIVTPGAIDSHVHLLSPRLIPVALSAGVTTLITAGFEEPAWRMLRTFEAFERFPMNLGLQASSRTNVPGFAERMIESGAIGLKIHEDWGASARIIDATLATAETFDVAVCIHTDGLNESGELEETVAAIAGRTVHAYHVEGVGGGHIPDLIAIVREPNVICSSTTPGLPYGRATAAEHPDMIMLVHEGNPAVPEDVAAARERIHPPTMAAEGPLHDLGAISIINSDSQGMGRIGETVRRTWQLAHVMKRWRTSEAGAGWPNEPEDDNERVLRYLAKITIEPARTHGIAADVGSLTPGHIADMVLWDPASFGVKPLAVMKGGAVAWGPIGQGNASVHGAEPTRYGPDWGATGDASSSLSTTFVSAAALDGDIGRTLGTRRRVVAVRGTRGLMRRDLAANTEVPSIEVSRADGTVTLDGRVLAAEPVSGVPLNRRFLLS